MLDEDQTGSDSQVRKSGADANRKTIVDDAEDDAAMRAALLASRRFARNPCRQRESVTAQEESKRRGPVSLKRSWGKGTDDVDLARKKKSEEGSTVSTKESDKAVSLGVKMLGTPNDSIWPGYSELPVLKRTQFAEYPFNNLRKHFGATLSDKGFHLLSRFLTYDPKARICALEASTHGWFVEEPRPVHPSLFPTWPAKSELVKASHSEQNQKPSSGGEAYKPTAREMDKDLLNTLRIRPHQSRAAGFTLKFDAVKF